MKPFYYELDKYVRQALAEIPNQGVDESGEDYVKRVFARANALIHVKAVEEKIVVNHIQV